MYFEYIYKDKVIYSEYSDSWFPTKDCNICFTSINMEEQKQNTRQFIVDQVVRIYPEIDSELKEGFTNTVKQNSIFLVVFLTTNSERQETIRRSLDQQDQENKNNKSE
jgi:hypothetical protein